MAKICLDAGHGGRDSGAVGFGRYEKNDVLGVVLKTGQILFSRGHDIFYTRVTDIYESPLTKAMEANNENVDFFVSAHRNSSADENANGYETLVYENAGQAKVLADYMNEHMAQLGFRNRGTKIRTDLTVLNSTKMDAVLLELGFISNEGDNKKFLENRDAICGMIADGIELAVGKENTGGSTQVIQKPETPSGKLDLGYVDCIYQCYTDRWWAPVHGQEDWGGKGDNYAIRYIAICVSKGSIKGRVYTRKNGWLPWLTFTNSYNTNDLVNGVLGDGSEILAVELYYYTPDGYEYKEVHYRVSVEGNNAFYAKQIDNKKDSNMDGHAGDKKRFVDKFQVWIE